MLSESQLKQREGKLTASRVSVLMTGDAAKVLNLWREMVGDPSYVEDDLTWTWPVQLGTVTEELNLRWYGHKYGYVARQGEVVTRDGWMAATLDGWDTERECPIECKHVGGREPLETIIARYQPQMHWQMLVCGAKECALSVVMAANEPTVEYLPFDAGYAEELMARALQFWSHVEAMTPPVALPEVTAPVPAVKIYDMTGNNEWASRAVEWVDNQTASKLFTVATNEIKRLTPSDAIKAVGHGIAVSRNRAGSLTIKGDKK